MEKASISGAVHLYVDFINIFLFLLRTSATAAKGSPTAPRSVRYICHVDSAALSSA